MDSQKEFTMLVVDDNRLNQKVLAALFSDEYNIISASNGADALEIIEQHVQIDIVMLDLFMPVMDGFETLKKCKELSYFKDIPVVIITSSNTLEDQLTAFELGASDFVTKPFIPEIVTTRITNIMNSRRRYLSLEIESRNMKNKAELDQMTGLYNQTTARHIINRILHEHKNQLHTMLLIDIDNFKAVNDLSGHLIGDHIIKIIADLISGHFRKSDIVARIGGDEFIVFMTDIPGMETAREKANSLIRAMRYKPNLTVPENVSLSIGFAPVEKNETLDYEGVFSRADEALYLAKKNGKAQAWEYGAAYQSFEELNKKNILLISRNRNTCSIVSALSPKQMSVIELVDLENLACLSPSDIERTILVYVDISDTRLDTAELLDRLYDFEWIKNVAVVPLCKEGDLKQYRTALQYPVKDLMSVPIDASGFQRRVLLHLK